VTQTLSATRKGDETMSLFRLNITMSLDGFVAGPSQSVDNPLGIGGMRLHDWVFGLEAWRKPHGLEGGETNRSSAIVERMTANVGATIMGRNMFGGHPGPWEKSGSPEVWNGWWGDDPPFHTPVFVLTHHPRKPLALEGGTTFYFVTDGIESALQQAKKVAGGKDIVLGGGANVAQQYLAARLLDEVDLALMPIFLRAGERLFDHLGDGLPGLEQVAVVEAPGVTHFRYRLKR
jgi:dihydrofolate reductase